MSEVDFMRRRNHISAVISSEGGVEEIDSVIRDGLEGEKA
jgi:hypothetical protein